MKVTIGNDILSPNGVFGIDIAENGFRLEFNPTLLMDYRDDDIVIRYEMALSEEAIADVTYLNEGKLEYDNNVLIDRDIVRTGGYRFVKVDIRDEERTLADAHFVLRNSENNYLVNVNGLHNWVANKEEATTFISDAEGSILISGLKYGRYYLEETKAPFRYVLSTTPVAFDVMYGTYNPGATMNIVNQPERPRLPITGGKIPPTPAPERPRLPITRGEVPAERPRLPRTGENVNIVLMAMGIMFISLAVVILTNENGKGGKKNEKNT